MMGEGTAPVFMKSQLKGRNRPAPGSLQADGSTITQLSKLPKLLKKKKKTQHSWLHVAIRTLKYDSFSWPAPRATSAHHMTKVEASEDSNVPDDALLD